MTRALASIRIIDALTPIEGADRIECAHIGGWNIVVKKGEFSTGDLCIYFEIDSWVPHDVAPFLSAVDGDGMPRLKYFNEVAGNRLRTKKLKGVISQGLILPLTVLRAYQNKCVVEGENVTELLSVQLYEKPLPAQLRGIAKGNFPVFLRKTDQERVQNLQEFIDDESKKNDLWEVTEKLDGSSMTVYMHEGVFGVCSRNLDLKQTEGNTFWDTALKYNLMNKVPEGYALQGELIGPDIQGNQYKLTGHKYYVFDIWDITKQQYLNAYERESMLLLLNLKGVPFLRYSPMINSIPQLLEEAKGTSFLNDSIREGIVFKNTRDPNKHFKVINNDWLLKYE